MSKELNWDNFSEAEKDAIAIAYKNMLDGTEDPIFPRCHILFDTLSELLADVSIVNPELSSRLCGELQCIAKVLLELPPSLANQEDMSDEEVQKTLLQNIVASFVARQFHQIIAQCNTASQMAVMGLTGGENESIH
ncbi:hypothetical protein N5886_07080 [Glaesserella parasuis]|nr:hypothetical protein [Glaesserella parasuis]MDP0380689.1 hypothetical protein [Glaesserella parasuis]